MADSKQQYHPGSCSDCKAESSQRSSSSAPLCALPWESRFDEIRTDTGYCSSTTEPRFYGAWNHLVKVEISATPVTRAEYEYNGLSWYIMKGSKRWGGKGVRMMVSSPFAVHRNDRDGAVMAVGSHLVHNRPSQTRSATLTYT